MFQLKNVLIRNVRCTMGRLHKKMDICSVMKATSLDWIGPVELKGLRDMQLELAHDRRLESSF